MVGRFCLLAILCVVAAAAGVGLGGQPGGGTGGEGAQGARGRMKAIRIHGRGGREVLRFEEAPTPAGGAGEVLIRVHAAGVNPVDWKVVRGGVRDLGRPLPYIPGYDASGVIAAVGGGGEGGKVGDEVFVYQELGRGGAYAEYMAVRAEHVARKPGNVDHVQAAGAPLAALTAWQALFEVADVQPGQTVLVHAAAGGVGTFAVQLAKAKGARVIGTASERNHEFLRSIGADEVIDYRTTRFEDVVRDVDVVLDAVGGETLERSYAVVKKGGIVVTIAGRPSEEKAAASGVRATWRLVRPDGEQLAEIARMIEAGTVRPVVSEVFPLAEAATAHERSQAGHTRGKIVLRVVEE